MHITIILFQGINMKLILLKRLNLSSKAIIVDDAKNLNLKMKCHVFTDIMVGLLSMIVWAIVMVICCPYVVYQGMDQMLNYEGHYDNTVNDYDKYWSSGYWSIRDLLLDQWLSTRSFSWLYIFRVIWRILDVTSRLFTMLLIWLVIGGLSLGIIIGFEFILFIALCIKTKHWELIFGIVALVVSLTPGLLTIFVIFHILALINLYINRDERNINNDLFL